MIFIAIYVFVNEIYKNINCNENHEKHF
jgi:hypothetical protein